MGVDAEVNIDGIEEDRMVNEKRHTTSSTTTSVFEDGSVAWDGRETRVIVEFRFLDGGDADFIGVQEVTKFI